jgi:hypothetical protein
LTQKTKRSEGNLSDTGVLVIFYKEHVWTVTKVQ